jgi:hypothetical protein
LLAVKRQAALTASITNFFDGFIPVCRAFKIFLAAAKQNQRPFLP